MCARLFASRFLRDRRGAIAILFAFALVPLLGVTGGAVDFSRANNIRAELQSALDMAMLSVANTDPAISDDEIRRRALAAVQANYDGQLTFPVSITELERERTYIRATAQATVPTTFLGILGIIEIPVSAISETSWGIGHLEVALVFDNSGSMRNFSRMTALKQAAAELVRVLEQGSYEEGSVKIGVVPFDSVVKTSTGLRDSLWLSIDALTRLLWGGCIWDRDSPHDTRDTAFTLARYPALPWSQSSRCRGELTTMMGLSEDFDAVRAKLASMEPAGNTNITIGLTWGHALLSPSGPFSGAEPYGTPDLQKILVLMTDGENTQNRTSNSTGQIDSRTRLACDEIKESGVIIFSVRAQEGNVGLLRDCASGPDYFYNADQVSDLLPAFRGIADRISQIRLSR